MKKLLLTVLICLLPVTIALADSAQQSFEQGNQAFEQRQYNEAINHYKNAEQHGMKLPALYYNLAASYYKLGQYDKAEFYFRKLLRVPGMKHLALYNLAVIEKKRGNLDKAQKQFEALAGQDTPAKIRGLAQRQLDDIRFLERDRNYVFVSSGYDSNISDASLNAGTGVADMYVQLYALTEGLISGNVEDNRRYEISVYNQTYLSTTAYDMTTVKIGYIIEKRQEDKRTRLTSAYSTGTYGGNPYVDKLTFDYRIYKTGADSRYQFDYYNSANVIYDYLSGYRMKYRRTSQDYRDGYRHKFYYEFEYNDRTDTGTTSYSPIRNTVRWYRYSPKQNGMYTRMDLALRLSYYPSVAGTQRNDFRTRFGYKRYYDKGEGASMILAYVFTLNLSTVPSDAYNKHVLSVAYQW
jgi:tetratricopeptide (TPR) repeat protein